MLRRAKPDHEADDFAWVAGLSPSARWRLHQAIAGDSRYYGDGGTIHHTGRLDVETFKGKVVDVWFRCQVLPFHQVEVTPDRAAEMTRAMERGAPAMTGVEVRD